MKTTKLALAALALPAALPMKAAPKEKTAKQPNILFVITDEHHASAFGATGNPVIKTPNLDRLAQEGVLYRNMYCAAFPSCPSRASLLTGLYPQEHGMISNDAILPADIPTWGTVFKAAGYNTAWVGKMHLGGQPMQPQRSESIEWVEGAPKFVPMPPGVVPPVEDYPQLGFDHWVSCVAGYKEYLQKVGEWGKLKNPNMAVRGMHQTAPVVDPAINAGYSLVPEQYFMESYLADEAINYLKTQNSGKPFLMGLSFPGPHSPYTPPKPWDTMYDPQEIDLPPSWDFTGFTQQGVMKNAKYHGRDWTPEQFKSHIAHIYGYVSYLDAQLGRVLDYMQKNGLWENTIIVFTADHGQHQGCHGFTVKSYQGWEEVLKVPFVVRMPESLKPERRGVQEGSLTSLTDLFPTLMDLCNVDKRPDYLVGRSFAAELKGQAPAQPREEVLSNVRQDGNDDMKMIRKGDFKLITWKNRANWELYDLKNDPWEMKNLARDAQYASKVAELKSLLDQKLAAVVRPPWTRTE